MLNKIKYIAHGLNYLFNVKIQNKQLPLIGALVVNEKCNLKCAHCQVANRPFKDLTYVEIKKGLNKFFDMGMRSLAIGGGEPFLWRDGKYDIKNVVELARKIGFQLIVIYTNGTFPLSITTDAIFVSLDGTKNTNDKLRGISYDKIIGNIQNSKHPNLWVNFTINKKNYKEIEMFCETMSAIKQVKGVFFYFHTPYYGIDDLFLNKTEKQKIIKKIIELKSRFKILNSNNCLEAVYNNSWIRPSEMCYVYAHNKLYKCCRSIGNKEACDNCGYLSYAEIIHAPKLHLSSIITALKFLPLSDKRRNSLLNR